ncbi:MAG: class II D-tagatose-bisphosphate aldolase, non-catalytic subunit [Anaerolineales bacterium]|nr:class II D-tagatose-bisphosphate aldolase, non-catalytic subunit [Anaerolineales bacterium]
MKPLNEVVKRIIELRQQGRKITLLAVCPNSSAVLEAAVRVAAANNTIMLFAATLNQVDRDGGYTGWMPAGFTGALRSFAEKYHWAGPLYPCLDHGGPWLKDIHTQKGLSFEETNAEVKKSLAACLEAGYALLHIDTTVDRTLPPGEPLAIETVVARCVDLISYSESERLRMGLPGVAYEVGSDEVHGGLVEFDRFNTFLKMLKDGLEKKDLAGVWPAFIVTQVGTDLHTTQFDALAAKRLYETVMPMGALIKGHYTDWVDNPADYPSTGMGGANVGPEFTSEEFDALKDLESKERILCRNHPGFQPSCFMDALRAAVVDSGRWKKWLHPNERDTDFSALIHLRQDWLLRTGARYIWAEPVVLERRQKLYRNVSEVIPDPHQYVLERVGRTIDRYIKKFNLVDSQNLLG